MRVFSLLVLFLVLISVALACKTKSDEEGSNLEKYMVEDEEEDTGEGDDSEEEDDETSSDDVSLESEDFDLICDSYQKPNRTKGPPDVIIIGVKKGGTRALIEFLKLHPKFKSAGPEIHFFDRKSNFEKGLDWYITHMPPVTEDQLAMEKTPGYFHHHLAAQRISRMIGHAKLLLILRDPVKRLISDYNQFRSRNLDMGKEYPALEELVLTEDGEVNIRYPPVQRSIYHIHMTRWFKYFPREQIHVVHGDNYIKEPWTELQRVESFLDVEPVISQDNFYFNGTKGFYCAQETRTTGVWECTKRKCLGKSKGRPKPPVTDEMVKKLKDFYRDHNKIFFQLMGKDYGWND